MPRSFPATVRYEQNFTYISSLPLVTGYDHWYGERLQVAGANPKTSREFTLSLPRVAPGAGAARLTARLAGNYDGGHHVRLYANGNQVYDGTWSGRTVYEAAANFSQGYLASGNNKIKVELINDTPGQIADDIRVDWLAVEYGRENVTDDDRLAFGRAETGTWLYQVKGFVGQDIDAYDVSVPAQVKRITGLTVGLPTQRTFLPLVLRSTAAAAQDFAAGGTSGAVATPMGQWAVTFGVTQSAPGRYVALTPARRSAVLRIERDASSGTLSSATSVDYIIISHRDFLSSVAPLAAYRVSQGKQVKVVDVEEIYDQFGYGLMSAEAIRDFIAYAYNTWPAPKPTDVLLVGDGTYDFRGYTSYNTRTFIPPYLEMVDPDAGEAATDNSFVANTAGDFLPDLNIGRLPANTAQEADAMVAKILAYEGFQPAAWMQRALFVTDDLSAGGGDFYALSNDIADGSTSYQGNTVKYLPAGYARPKIYMSTVSPTPQAGTCN
jgi:hypothetical protein